MYTHTTWVARGGKPPICVKWVDVTYGDGESLNYRPRLG